jgi:hypothetical protein
MECINANKLPRKSGVPPFREERRIKFANAANLDRKSGVAGYLLALRSAAGEAIQSGRKLVLLNNEQLTDRRK